MKKAERLRSACDYIIEAGLEKNYLGIGQSLGYKTRQSLSHMFSGDLPISQKLLQKIEVVYPSINISWIETGKGEMICNSKQVQRRDKESKMDRFTKYLYAENIPIYQALERLNWTRRTYDKAREDDLSEKQMMDIAKTFANINIDWLKKGSGAMIKIEQENVFVLLKRMQKEIDILKRDVARLKAKK